MAEQSSTVITRGNPVVDEAILASAAAREFRLAAVRLSDARPQTDAASQAAREAAQAIVSLAVSHDEVALRRFLRPNPHHADVTWTVACYQIGDLTPCALLDFANPVAAVATLAGCEDASHVAAELVASTPAGTRWTAMTRTGRSVSFQLPDGRSASDTTGRGDGELSLVGDHWRQQLAGWSAAYGEDHGGPVVVPWPDDPIAAAAAAPPSPEPAPRAVKSPPPPRLGARVAPPPALAPPKVELEPVLELVIQALRSMDAARGQDTPPAPELLGRLEVFARDMTAMADTVAALERRVEALGTYAAELTRALAAQQAASSARLEARLDQLLARFEPQDFTA